MNDKYIMKMEIKLMNHILKLIYFNNCFIFDFNRGSNNSMLLYEALVDWIYTKKKKIKVDVEVQSSTFPT